MIKKYQSRYSLHKFVTAAQYITEIICEKKAFMKNEELPLQFWKQPKWTMFYRQQIVAANGLLRIYSAKAIIQALQKPPCKYIYSLRSPQLDGLIQREEQQIKLQQKAKKSNLFTTSIMSKPRQKQIKSNNISKLKQLD